MGFRSSRSERTEMWIIGFIILACVVLPILFAKGCGVGGWGPTVYHQNATIQRAWVDNSKEGSHYMVATDRGVFEVDNGVLLGMWNADEVYGQMVVGKKYNITTKGKRWTNVIHQHYPYVVKVEPIIEPPANLNIEKE